MPATLELQMRADRISRRYMAQRFSLRMAHTLLADEAFLRESILNPSMHTVAGYAPIMPTYQGQISEEGLISVVEFIKNLNSNYRVQQTLNTSELAPTQESIKAGAASGTSKATAAPSAPGMVK